MGNKERLKQDWIKAYRYYGKGTPQELKAYSAYVKATQGIKEVKQTTFLKDQRKGL